MSSTGISGMGKLFAQSNAQEIAVTKSGSNTDFGKFMNGATSSADNAWKFQDRDISGSDGTKEPKNSNESYDRYQYRKSSIHESSQNPVTDMEQAADKMDDYSEDVKEVLKENLGVSDEEIENAMATLGLTIADLQNPAQLANLVSELTGGADIGELLCNSDFLQIMKEVQSLNTALKEELGISVEELRQLCDTLMNQFNGKTEGDSPEQKVLDQEVASEAISTGPNSPTAEAPMLSENEEQMADEVFDNVQKESLQSDVKADASKQQADGEEEDTESNGEHSQTLEKKTTILTEDKHSVGQSQEDSNALFGNTMEQKLSEAMKTSALQPAASYTGHVDAADVIKQIVEAARVTMASAETTMELQLNPEHLGKIYLEVTSREGSITARIMAQDEAVKAALETQVAELKQSMEQAGIKVEAVEVTVGSHEFERNLEQNAGQQERQAEEQEKSQKQTRQINLNDLSELTGIMTEEEVLAAKIMTDAGNSVDFTA